MVLIWIGNPPLNYHFCVSLCHGYFGICCWGIGQKMPRIFGSLVDHSYYISWWDGKLHGCKDQTKNQDKFKDRWNDPKMFDFFVPNFWPIFREFVKVAPCFDIQLFLEEIPLYVNHVCNYIFFVINCNKIYLLKNNTFNQLSLKEFRILNHHCKYRVAHANLYIHGAMNVQISMSNPVNTLQNLPS